MFVRLAESDMGWSMPIQGSHVECPGTCAVTPRSTWRRKTGLEQRRSNEKFESVQDKYLKYRTTGEGIELGIGSTSKVHAYLGASSSRSSRVSRMLELFHMGIIKSRVEIFHPVCVPGLRRWRKLPMSRRPRSMTTCINGNCAGGLAP